MNDAERRFQALETRLIALEDQVAIYQLMSSYGPLVDSGDAEATSRLWVEDGVYDWGGGGAPDASAPVTEGEAGAAFSQAAIADMVRGPYHQQIIAGGAGHVIGMPHIVLDGDRATATSYSRLYRYEDGGFRVWRVGANRWEFTRTPAGWRVTSRVNRTLNGSSAARDLLRSGIPSDERHQPAAQ